MGKINRFLVAIGVAIGAVLLMGASYSHSAADSGAAATGAVAALGAYADVIANDDGTQWNKLAKSETALLLETAFYR